MNSFSGPVLHHRSAFARGSRRADLKTSRAFWSGTIGLQVTAEAEDQTFLRAMEERGHHCIVLRKAKRPAANALSFKVWEEDNLGSARDAQTALGRGTKWVERPYQGQSLASSDPYEVPIEFYARMDRLPSLRQSYASYRGVKPLRIDHFNCFSPNVDKSVAFWNALGFRVTEYTVDADSGALWAAWMHRKGGVHDMAFTNGLGPRLHHTTLWVPTPLTNIDFLDPMATTAMSRLSSAGRGGTASPTPSSSIFSSGWPPNRTSQLGLPDRGSDHEPIHRDPNDTQRQTLWRAPAPNWLVRSRLGFRRTHPTQGGSEGGAHRRAR